MKYSMCTTWAKEQPVEQVLETAEKLGMDGIEIWSGHVDRFLEEGKTLADLTELLEKRGLKCIVISPYLNLIEEKGLEKNMDLARRCVTYASCIKVLYCQSFPGG